MTILEAITRADLARPNELDPELKLRWLSALDGQIHAELLAPYGEGAPSFDGYGEETELGSTELLAPFPYDELYLHWLIMRIDLAHGELERYNNDALAFNRILRSYAGHYTHNHTPVGETALRF